VKHMKVVFSVQFIRNSDKRSTAGLRNSVIYDHHVVFAVGGNGGMDLQRHGDVINTRSQRVAQLGFKQVVKVI